MTYGKFIEIKGKEAVKIFNFSAKAISSDETRYFMNVAICTEGKLISTDARRMHIVEKWVDDFGFEDGKVYRFLKGNTKESWWAEVTSITAEQFPAWERVMPDSKEKIGSVLFNSVPMTAKSYFNNPYKEYTRLLRAIPSGNTINFLYLKDLIPNKEWEVTFFGENKAIQLKSENYGCTAIIMPLTMDN